MGCSWSWNFQVPTQNLQLDEVLYSQRALLIKVLLSLNLSLQKHCPSVLFSIQEYFNPTSTGHVVTRSLRPRQTSLETSQLAVARDKCLPLKFSFLVHAGSMGGAVSGSLCLELYFLKACKCRWKCLATVIYRGLPTLSFSCICLVSRPQTAWPICP